MPEEMTAQPNAVPAAAAPDHDSIAPAEDLMADDAENVTKGSVNLQKAFSRINESLIRLADDYARRAATVPHIKGQSMGEHMNNVGEVVSAAGGLTANLMLATHSVHDSEGGRTIAYPAAKLREAIVPAKNEDAKAAIDATKSFVSKAATLLGDDANGVKTARQQLQLIGAHDGAGMTVADLIAALVNVPFPLIQDVARAHSAHKHGGSGHPMLTAPQDESSEAPADSRDEQETPAQAPTVQEGQ